MKISKAISKVFLTVLSLLFLTCAFTVVSSAGGITVTTPKFEAVSADTTSISFKWSSNQSVYCFKLYVLDTDTNRYNTVYKGKKTEITLSGLEPGAEYTYALRSYIYSGGKLYASKLARLTVNTTLDSPTGLKESENTYNSHRISWNSVDGADGYFVYYYNAAQKKYVRLGQTTKPSCKLTKLSSAYAYRYKIIAFSRKTDGSRIYSKASKAFIAVTLPAPVSTFTASAVSTNSFTLTWKEASGSQGYRIYERNPETNKYTVVATVRNTLTLPISSKETAESYFYVIRSFAKINGKVYFSNLSKELTVTTKPNAPVAVINPDRTGNAVLQIAWSEVDKADGYLIYTSERKNSGFVLKKKVSAGTLECAVSGLSKTQVTYVKIKAYVLVGDKMVYSANSKLIGARA